MGHHRTPVRAVGRNRQEAEQNALADFLYENGHRHSFRDFESATLLRKVPPKKNSEERRGNHVYITTVDDADAPIEKWLEEWEFVIHTHT